MIPPFRALLSSSDRSTTSISENRNASDVAQSRSLCRHGTEMHGYYIGSSPTEKPRYCYLSAHFGHKRFCRNSTRTSKGQ